MLPSCSPSDKAVYNNFGVSLLMESLVVYQEVRDTPLLGDGYRFVQYDVSPKCMERIKEDGTILSEKGFVRIDEPVSVQDCAPLNIDYTVSEGIMKHGIDSGEYLFVDYNKLLISYLALFGR